MGKEINNVKTGDVRYDPYGKTGKERAAYDCPRCGRDVFFTSKATPWKEAECECGKLRPEVEEIFRERTGAV